MVAATGVEESRQPVAREIEVADDELDRLLRVDDRFEAIHEAKDDEAGLLLPASRHGTVGDHTADPAVAKLGQAAHQCFDTLAGVGPAHERDRSQTAVAVARASAQS